MSRNSRSSKGKQQQDNRRGRVSQGRPDMNYEYIEPPVPERRVVEPLRALTRAQGEYMSAIQDSTIIFGIGPAGTGKSYVAAAMAADALADKMIDRIIITRPAVESGEKLGALPGELEEKYSVYVEPFLEILNERLGVSQVKYLMKHNRISARPLAYMRGSTFKDCYAILDESQNCSKTQVQMFLTRLGKNCKAIVNGDIDQSDIHGMSGLEDAVNRFQHVRNVAIVEFGEQDIVRSGIVREVIKAYRK